MSIGAWRGVFERVEDVHRPPTLRAGHPWNGRTIPYSFTRACLGQPFYALRAGCKAVSGVAKAGERGVAGEEGVDPIVDTFYVTVYMDCIMNSGKDVIRVLKRRKGGSLGALRGHWNNYVLFLKDKR
jgi:hypothetical protein